MSEEEKTEHDSAADGNQVVEEKPKKKTSKWEAVPIPTGGTINVQSNAPQSSYLNNDMNTASHAIKGKDKKENWQRIQRTTFTNWINNRLQGGKSSYSGPEVYELEVNLQDGVILARLMEVLAGLKIKGVNKTPKIKAHKIDNLTQVLKVMETEKIRLVSITPEAISQGQLKLIMGLIWTLILKYQIKFKPTAKISAKKAMVVWLQTMMPAANITNLTSDWQSGFALLSLIDNIKPGLIPPLSTLDPSKGLHNCTMAMKIAKNHLKIPQILAPEDICNLSIDEVSMMTYLSYFCDPAANKLIKWVQKMVPHLNIKNLTTDWNDGLALAALLDARFPGVFPDAAQLQSHDAFRTLQRCLEICEEKMGIKPVITEKDIMDPAVDELMMMALLSSIKNGTLIALPDEIDATGPGLEVAAVGKPTNFTVDCTCGGPGKLDVDIYNTSFGKQIKHVMYESKPMIHTVKYQPNETGELSIEILWSGNPIPNSPFRVSVTDSAQLRIIDLSDHITTVNVNQVITLDLDATTLGRGSLKAFYQYEDNEEAMTTEVQENYDQTYTLKYSFPRSGTAAIHVFWNGEELPHCKVTYNIVNSEYYTLLDPPDEQLFHTMYPVKFRIQAESKAALPLLTILETCGDTTAPVEVSTIEGDIGTVSFIPTTPGEHRIDVYCVNRHILGSPFTIYAVDASQCFLANTLPKTMAVGMSHEFQLETKEAGPGGASFDIEDRDVNEIFQVSAYEEGSLVIFKVIPLVCGEYIASLKWSDQHVSCSPFRLSIFDPKKCRVEPNLSEMATIPVGKPLNFLVSCKGAGSSAKPVIKAQGITALYNVEIGTYDTNEYSVTFMPWEVGKLEVSITWGGYPIPNSPFNLEVLGFHSGMCTAQGEGLQKTLTTVPGQFVIKADQKNLIADGYLVIQVKGVVKQVECRVRAEDNKDGTYRVAYLAKHPGAYLISITVHGDHIPGSPFKMTAVPGPDASKCIAYGPALERTTILSIGKPIDFSVDTHNAGTGDLSVRAVGPGGVLASVYTSNGDSPGVYDIRLDPVRHGKYRVSVKWSNQHIPDSPFRLKIFPGVDATKCKAYGPGLADSQVGEQTHFVVETKNAGAGSLNVQLHGANEVFNMDISPKDPLDVRTLEAKYNPPKAGDYLITIKWDGTNIPGSPFKVQVTGDEGDEQIVRRPIPHSFSDTGFDFGEDDEVNIDDTKRKMTKSLSETSGFERDQYVTDAQMPDFGSVGKKRYQKSLLPDKGVKIRSDTTTRGAPKRKVQTLPPRQIYPGYGGGMMMHPMMMPMQQPMMVQQPRKQQKRRR